MNKFEGVGRLTKDPEIKTTSKTTIANFTVAIDRRFKEADGTRKADFISCVAFGKTAELLKNFFRKGSWIGIVGSIQTRTYQKQDGTTAYVTEVVTDEVYFVGDKKSEPQTQTQQLAPEIPNDGHVNSDLMNKVMSKREEEKARDEIDMMDLPFEF